MRDPADKHTQDLIGSTLIGYARVSTDDQDLSLQLDALTAAGCGKVFADKGVSGVQFDRPELVKCLEYCRPGDALVIWRLDRLGRSTKHLIELAQQLQERGIGLRSLRENIDTTTATGRFFFSVMAALAEMERDLIVERTRAGMSAAKARGRNGGRPQSVTDEQVDHARTLLAAGKSLVDVAKTLKVSRATLYRRLRKS